MAPEWSRLLRVIAEDDGSTWKPTPTELGESLEPSSTFDPSRQTWSTWHGEEMVAFAEAGVSDIPAFDGRNKVYVLGGVHPAWRGQGLGTMLLELSEATGERLGRQHLPNAPLVFTAHTTDSAPTAARLLEENGYVEARYWFDMTHDLRGEFIDDPRTAALTDELSEAVRLAHNDAFSTHWGSAPISEEKWQRFEKSSTLRRDLSRIFAVDGEVLAYAIVSSTVAGEAYFDLIGVRGSAQGQGLGRAVLTSALAAIQADGSFTEAGLDVDADNPSGAGKLYTSAGFESVAKKLTWEKLA